VGDNDGVITIRGEGFTPESSVVVFATFDGWIESGIFDPEFLDDKTLAVFLPETPLEALDIGVHVANGSLLFNVEILLVTGRMGGSGCDDDRTPPGRGGEGNSDGGNPNN